MLKDFTHARFWKWMMPQCKLYKETTSSVSSSKTALAKHIFWCLCFGQMHFLWFWKLNYSPSLHKRLAPFENFRKIFGKALPCVMLSNPVTCQYCCICCVSFWKNCSALLSKTCTAQLLVSKQAKLKSTEKESWLQGSVWLCFQAPKSALQINISQMYPDAGTVTWHIFDRRLEHDISRTDGRKYAGELQIGTQCNIMLNERSLKSLLSLARNRRHVEHLFCWANFLPDICHL